MDTSADSDLTVRLLKTDGQGQFEETTWTVPPLEQDEIRVKAVLTGVCRSDIDMMQGTFGPLPDHMQGHEGLGMVVAVGEGVDNVKVGDYVATRGEPAYADYYNVRENEYVVVPKAEPRYILEPVACGVNVIEQPMQELYQREGEHARLLINGSGFLAWVAYHTILNEGLEYTIDVLGSSNKELWGDKLIASTNKTYDVIIDLGGKLDYFDGQVLNNNALIVLASPRAVQTDFSALLWKACTIIMPSPRTENFYDCMITAKYMIQKHKLKVDSFWTQGYDRDTEWRQAFEDGATRPPNYSRGYIRWNNG